jgi:hypothetical protein
MSSPLNPFSHPSGLVLLKDIRNLLLSKSIYQVKNRKIVFLCGGPVKKWSRSLRYQFLKYASSRLPDLRFFLAENVANDLLQFNEPRFINIAKFESFMAKLSDCIVLFPESYGSIAEIGFFTNSKEILGKLLVANNDKHQDDSFINLGPVDLVNEKSLFKPTLYIDYTKPNFSILINRIKTRLPSKQAKKFHFKNYKNLELKERLYLTLSLISFFRVISFDSLQFCAKKIFNYYNDFEEELKQLISFLISARYVKRIGDGKEFVAPESDFNAFLEFRNYDISELQASTALFFKKNHPESYRLLQEIK